jgi:cytochrome c biogenesis factor
MLKLWNILLITLAFQFTLLGTFITRSGIIKSVHAFTESDIGGYFLGFIIVSTAAVIWLVAYRWQRLKSANRLESLLSRESAFVLNNWLLVGLTLIILWGTLWPIISEAIQGKKIRRSRSVFQSGCDYSWTPTALFDRCRSHYFLEKDYTQQFSSHVFITTCNRFGSRSSGMDISCF